MRAHLLLFFVAATGSSPTRLNETGSDVGGDGLPAAGERRIPLENVAPEAVGLSFELVLARRP